MTNRYVLPLVSVALLIGCQSKTQQGKAERPLSYNASPKQMNDRTVEDLLAEADKAEKAGEYQHAMEVYQRLNSFPEASRPRDLQARKDRLNEKMKASAK